MESKNVFLTLISFRLTDSFVRPIFYQRLTLWPNRKNWTMRLSNHFLSHTAHQGMGKTCSSMGRHDDQIGTFFFGGLDYFLSRRPDL